MDERGTDRGTTGSGGKRQARGAQGAPGKGPGASGRPQGTGSGRPQGGGSGRPQGSGSGRPQGGASGRPQGGGSGRPRGGSGRPGGGRKVTGSARKAAARRRQERRRRAIIATAVAAVVVIAIVVVALVANRKPAATAAPSYDRVGTFSGLSRTHTSSPVHYAQTPPVGGNHNPVWQNCGYYPQPLHNENAVHSMEHGAVWITYQPNLPKDQVDRLANLGRGQPYVLVSPYPGLPAPVVASAWGVQEWFRNASDSKLNEFLSKYRQGPQTPEPGALCTNGTGTPE
jgi:Protein of unknown function (DUF3105)